MVASFALRILKTTFATRMFRQTKTAAVPPGFQRNPGSVSEAAAAEKYMTYQREREGGRKPLFDPTAFQVQPKGRRARFPLPSHKVAYFGKLALISDAFDPL